MQAATLRPDTSALSVFTYLIGFHIFLNLPNICPQRNKAEIKTMRELAEKFTKSDAPGNELLHNRHAETSNRH